MKYMQDAYAIGVAVMSRNKENVCFFFYFMFLSNMACPQMNVYQTLLSIYIQWTDVLVFTVSICQYIK